MHGGQQYNSWQGGGPVQGGVQEQEDPDQTVDVLLGEGLAQDRK